MRDDEHTPQTGPAGKPAALGAWSATSPYSWWLALIATVMILGVSIAVAAVASGPLSDLLGLGDVAVGRERPETISVPPGLAMAWLLVSQTVTSVLVLGAAGLYGADRWRLLSLAQPAPARTVLWALGGMILMLAPYNAVVFAITPQSAIADLKPFGDLMHSDARWLTAAVVCIGAPLSEELLFRGFLLPALAQSRLGFRGAAILSTTIWAALHTGYSLAGLLEVTIIGLYFSWVLWRWGSLWITIASHALYNSALMVVLSLIRL